jgi:hypothetical protein
VQLSKLAGTFTEEDCWNFFSDGIAPATSCTTEMPDTSLSSSEECMTRVMSFLQILGERLINMATYKVSSNHLMM